MKRRIAATCVAALSLAGCMDAAGDITINPDGTGQVTYTMTVRAQALLTLFGDVDMDRETVCGDFIDDTTDDINDEVAGGGDQVAIEPIDDGTWCGVRVTGDLADVTAPFARTMFGEAPIIARDGEDWTVTIDGANTPSAFVVQEAESLELGASEFDALYEDLRTTVRISTPGPIGEIVGGKTDGSCVGVFTIDADNVDETFSLRAANAGECSSGGGTPPLVVVFAIVAALGAAGSTLLWRRKGPGGAPGVPSGDASGEPEAPSDTAV